MFGVLYGADESPIETLITVAREFSPRIELCGSREVLLDLSGLERLFGSARAIAEEMRRDAADRGLRVRVAIAGTRTAARLLAHHRAGVTVIEPGTEADTLAPCPLTLLEAVAHPDTEPSHTAGREASKDQSKDHQDIFATFRRWGLRTLGDLAGLPRDAVAARLGQAGVTWQRWARGEDPRPMQPTVPEEPFEQALDLEWPIDGLEPLSFVLGRLLEPLSARLERRDRGAAVLHVRLHLVRGPDGSREIHERSLELPTPIRDARTLRTLALLDLESHPPAAAIDRVVVAVDPTPGRILQFSLLTRPVPSPEQISTLAARLNALMGQGRCGAPAKVDSWYPGAFGMTAFTPPVLPSSPALPASPAPPALIVALRRFRVPVPARVRIDGGTPVRVDADRRGLNGHVTAWAGPWRTSGGWWAGGAGGANEAGAPHPPQWDRDEWDVTLSDGATYRLFRERLAGTWFLEGIVD